MYGRPSQSIPPSLRLASRRHVLNKDEQQRKKAAFKGKFCRRCHFKSARAQGFVCKFLLDRRCTLEDKNDALDLLEEYLEDGDMVHGYDNLQDNCLLYSLNKRKRWMIATHVVDLVDRREIQNDEFRLVLHERSGGQLKTDSIGYHGSKCGFHHCVPNGHYSSLTDLTLMCDLYSRATVETTRKSRKFHCKDVMRGDVHLVAVPEIRYEVTYTDRHIGRCKCPTDPDFRQRWETKVKNFGWKKKGNRNKSGMLWFYQGLDHKERQMYYDGYRDDSNDLTTHQPFEEHFDGVDVTESLHHQEMKTRNFTINDFCRNSGKCNDSKNVKNKKRKKEKLHNKKNIEKLSYTTIPRPKTASSKRIPYNYQKENISNTCTTQVAEVKWKTKRVKDKLDFDSLNADKSFCSCMVAKDSIEEVRESPNGLKIFVGNCVPQQLSMNVIGETTEALLLLWQKSEWSKWSFVAEYWIKVLLKPNTTGQLLLPICLREELNIGESDKVYKVQELVDAARRAVNLVTAKQGHTEKSDGNFELGQLMARISRAKVTVKTLQEAYTTLTPTDTQSSVAKKKKIWEMALTFDGALLESYELLPTSLTQTVDFGFCKACLRRFEPPLLNGCVLLPCLHYYCVECWRKYIWEEMKKCTTTISCQDNTCDEVVDEVMIQVLMPCELFNQWLVNCADESVAKSGQWRQCPVSSCDKVVKVTKPSTRFPGGNIPVMCKCDKVWCFSCDLGVHWPATCNQYSVYRRGLEDSTGYSGLRAQTIEKYHYTPSHSSADYYMMSIEHRYQWRNQFYLLRSILWHKLIRKRERFCTRRQKKKASLNDDKMLATTSLEKLNSCLGFLRDVHFVMEAICLLLSETTQEMLPPKVMTLLQRLYFSINTLTKMFNQRRLDKDDIQRMLRTQSNIETALKLLAVFVQALQMKFVAKKL